MLDAARNHHALSGIHIHPPVAEFHREPSLPHQEELIDVIVVMPGKHALRSN